jgi:gluconokinase
MWLWRVGLAKLIVVMGVSGCGKSTVGTLMAEKLELPFVDGDDLHPPENVDRMKAGVSLNDETRRPWLAAICECAESHFVNNQSVIIACSALKKIYREQLRSVSKPVQFVFLNGTKKLIAQRLSEREGHFMPESLLDSQFADLENPVGEDGVVEVAIDEPSQIDRVVGLLARLN